MSNNVKMLCIAGISALTIMSQANAINTEVQHKVSAIENARDMHVLDTGLDIVGGMEMYFFAGNLASSGPQWGDPVNADGYDNDYMGFPRGSLIGVVGNSEPFLVGVSTTITAQVSGRLYLAYNDDTAVDNAGFFNVHISLSDNQPKLYPNGILYIPQVQIVDESGNIVGAYEVYMGRDPSSWSFDLIDATPVIPYR